MSFKEFVALLLLSGMFASTLISCETTGKAAGKAAGEVEEGAEDFKKGYEKGKK
jgi:hypothetical protein